MRLSEAVMLGSTTVRLDPGIWFSRDLCSGCLIGMGLIAAIGKEAFTASQINETWPWLEAQRFTIPVCLHSHFSGSVITQETKLRGWEIISAMAMEVERGNMTLEAAVDWIRQNEPPEPSEVTPTPETVRERIEQPVGC